MMWEKGPYVVGAAAAAVMVKDLLRLNKYVDVRVLYGESLILILRESRNTNYK